MDSKDKVGEDVNNRINTTVKNFYALKLVSLNKKKVSKRMKVKFYYKFQD